MQITDRPEFDTQLERLCAAFNVPATEARKSAYFTGLAKLSILQVCRAIDHACAADGCDEFPTVHRLREFYYQSRRSSAQPADAQAPKDDPDHLEYFANRLLWMHLSHRGGFGSTGRFVPAHGMVDCQASADLEEVQKFKRELVAEFAGYIAEGDDAATPAAFVRMWHAGLVEISDVLPRTERDLERLAQAPHMQTPFPAFMARELRRPPSVTPNHPQGD